MSDGWEWRQEPAGPPDDVADPERVIARLRPHARRLAWPVVFLVLVCGGGGFIVGLLPRAWMNLAVLGVVVLLVLVLTVLPVLRWLGHRYVVTTRRVVITRGLVVRTRQELLHSRGYDVTVRRVGWQGLFRSGDVLVNAGLERPVRLVDVPSADLVMSALQDLMEQNATRIGAHRQQSQAEWTPPPGAWRTGGEADRPR